MFFCNLDRSLHPLLPLSVLPNAVFSTGGYGPPAGRAAPQPPPFTPFLVSAPQGSFPAAQAFPPGYATPPPYGKLEHFYGYLF